MGCINFKEASATVICLDETVIRSTGIRIESFVSSFLRNNYWAQESANKRHKSGATFSPLSSYLRNHVGRKWILRIYCWSVHTLSSLTRRSAKYIYIYRHACIIPNYNGNARTRWEVVKMHEYYIIISVLTSVSDSFEKVNNTMIFSLFNFFDFLQFF